MKTSELTGLWLDYWVAKAEGRQPERFNHEGHAWVRCKPDLVPYCPSTLWGEGGPIIEREQMTIEPFGDEWGAGIQRDGVHKFYLTGPTPLVAAMRAYLASKFGDELPDETT